MVLLVNVASLSLSLYSLSPMSPPLHKAGPNGDSKAQPSDGTRPMHPVCLWLQSPTHTAHTQQAQLLRSDVRMSPLFLGAESQVQTGRNRGRASLGLQSTILQTRKYPLQSARKRVSTRRARVCHWPPVLCNGNVAYRAPATCPGHLLLSPPTVGPTGQALARLPWLPPVGAGTHL